MEGISKNKEAEIDIEQTIYKLQNSGYGWINRDDCKKIISIVLESIDQQDKK